MRGVCRAYRVFLTGDRVPRTLLLVGLLLLSVSHAKGEFAKKDADLQQPPSSLCPSGCICTEQKIKLAQADQDLSFMEDEPDPSSNLGLQKTAKGKSEVLKNGIRVQCQSPTLTSLRKLSIPGLLAENMVQLDLSGCSLTKLSPSDFTSSYPLLQKLILKNNQIRDIMPGTFSAMKNLKYLDLSNNQLANFSSNVLGETSSLERIKLNGNLLNCNCHLGELLTYVSSRNIKVQGSCGEPAKLKDRPLARLVVEELSCPLEDPVTVEMKPNTNQIVFEGDPLRLGCRLKTGRPVSVGWQHRAPNQTAVTVTASNVVELSSSSRETPEGGGIFVTDSQMQIRNLQPRHGGTWTCSWGGRSASVEVTVLSLTTPTCASQATNSNKGRYAWPRTMANLKIALPCQANPNVQAFRLCGNNGIWEEPDLNSCYYLSEVTKVLEQFAKTNLTFSKTSALESARRLKSYLSDVVSLTDPHEAVFVTQTLHNYLEASGKHPELLPIIMDVYTILLKQEPAVLADSRHGLVTLLQQAPLKTPEFEYQSFGLAVEKCGVPLPPPGKPSAGTCTWRRPTELSSSSPVPKAARNRFQASCLPPLLNASGSIEASAWIPFTADGAASGSFEQQNVVLSLIHSTNPFVIVSSKPSRPLVTPVLGITSGHVTNLINRTVPFIITLRLSRHVSYGERLVGARWNQYMDQWNPEQCQTIKEDLENKLVTFQCCCGFGFFAAFTSQSEAESVTVRARSNSTAVPVPVQLLNLLPPPVYVGSVVGMLCHLTACLCYLIHGSRLKMTQPTRHALMNGWLSMALLMTTFTLGVRPMLGKVPCQVAGLLLHYLTLSTLLWMVVNASSLYKHITKSAGRTEPGEADSQSLMEEALAGHETVAKPALRFYLIGWGIPVIVVGIAGAIHMEQYYSPFICFLAWTPALGAVGLPSAILILLILTFHLLSWGYFRHTARLAAIQKQLAAQAVASAEALPSGSAQSANQREQTAMSNRVNGEKPPNVPKSGYVQLTGDGDGTSCPSNIATQVTETSDLASVSSDQERIALLVSVAHQRGEAEGAQSANEGGASLHAGRSESERPLLVTSSASSNDILEDGTVKTEVDDHGHSNPLMTSFTEDGDSKKLAASSAGAPSVIESTPIPVNVPQAVTNPPTLVQTPTAVDESDEKCPLSQLRCQVVYLILFCLTWLSGLCVVTRPFRDVLPYDELLSSLSYAIFGIVTGLHTVVFHLLTRADVSASCFGPSHQQSKGSAAPSEPNAQAQAPAPSSTEQPIQQHFGTLPRNGAMAGTMSERPTDEVDRPHRIISIGGPIPDSMNVSIMDPALLVNSFYDARQSKTARRFFQKQKLLHQMQNNHQHHHQLSSHHHRHHHHNHHRHSRHSSSAHSINNSTAFRSQSHSPIAEEALLNASSSSKAKVSNVNIHVEMGAYDWHELQSRLSDSSSWTKSGKQMPNRIDYRTGSASAAGSAGAAASSRTSSRNDIPLQVTVPARPVTPQEQLEELPRPTLSAARSLSSVKSDKRKRPSSHARTPKKSKWDTSSEAAVGKPSYVGNHHRDRALAHQGPSGEPMKTLPAAKPKVMDDSLDDDGASYLKRETSV